MLAAADLRGADLARADLAHSRLTHANLAGANLSGAVLDYADLAGANLSAVNLCGARLYNVRNLSRSQLEDSLGDEATILPLHLQGCVPWSAADGEPPVPVCDATAFWLSQARRDLRRRTVYGQTVRVAGVLAVGAAVATGVVSETAHEVAPPGPAKTQTSIPPSLSPIPAVQEEPSILCAAVAPVLALSSPPTLSSLEANQTLPPAPAAPPAAVHVAAPAQTKDALPAREAISPSVATTELGMTADAAVPLSASAAAEELEAPAYGAVMLASAEPVTVTPANAKLSQLEAWQGALPELHTRIPKLQALALRRPLRLKVVAPARAIVPLVRAFDDPNAPAPAVAAPPAREPVMLVVSLDAQRLDVYRGIKHLTTAKISSGMPGYDTRTGVFSILEKKRRHHSNLYGGAPMPWMQRLTRSGTALHAGAIPGYPASHGCVRLPYSFAPKLFELTKVGENVVVTRGRPVPTRIEHPNLFQLPPLNPQVAMAADATSLPRQLSDAVTLTKASARGDQDFAAAFRSEEPLRILVTRRTAHDRVIAVQYLLADLGYLPRQNFTGALGSATRNAIRAFQRGNALPETGAFTDELVSEVYRVAGKTEPPQGHLYVRQDFNRVFDTPIALRDPEVSLGTHVFTVVKREGDEAAPEWMAVSLDGDAVRTLDRVDIPEEVRRSIAPRLTRGSTLIIADRSEYSAILPEGDDYLVSSDEPAKTADAKVEQASAVPVRLTPVKAKQPKPRAAKATTASKPRTYTSFRREIRRRSFIRPSPYSLPYLFGR
jgi:lipoprotein-anchoring transpeptidase ErfK/SrfK/peptidoglycan hydrolase-like protein with peptidoglycan-binding domain